MQLALFGGFVSYMNTAMTPPTRALAVVPKEDPTVTLLTRSHVVEQAQQKHQLYLSLNTLVEKVELVHPKPNKYKPPQMAWLLSYPNRLVCGSQQQATRSCWRDVDVTLSRCPMSFFSLTTQWDDVYSETY